MDTISYTMRAMEGGRFLMGSPANEPERDNDESPHHFVTLSPFWLGATEVTQAQYQRQPGGALPMSGGLESQRVVVGDDSDLTSRVQAIIAELVQDQRDLAFKEARETLDGVEGMTIPVSTQALGWLYQALASFYMLEDDTASARREWRLACAIDSAADSFHASLPSADRARWAEQCAASSDNSAIEVHVPSGATFYLDGRRQEGGRVSVKPGQHLVQVLGGSKPRVKRVELSAGQRVTLTIPGSDVGAAASSPDVFVVDAVMTNYTTASIGYAMQVIQGGSFTMGSPSGESGRKDNEGGHEVTLSPFWMGATEVTQGQYQAVTGQNPSDNSTCGPSCPVEKVGWCDAVLFCNHLSQREGLPAAYELPDSFVLGMDFDTCNVEASSVHLREGTTGYRLPTEAEWEYAARAGSATAYWSGDRETDLARVGWYKENSATHTHPVGQKEANPWGLHDVHGNVWEWVWDEYGRYPSFAVVDPVGPSGGVQRMARGGCFVFSASWARSAFRYFGYPGTRDWSQGLRLARSSNLMPPPPSP